METREPHTTLGGYECRDGTCIRCRRLRKPINKLWVVVAPDGFVWDAYTSRKEASETLAFHRADEQSREDFRGAVVVGPFVRTAQTKTSRS